jgi:hypothetical protein
VRASANSILPEGLRTKKLKGHEGEGYTLCVLTMKDNDSLNTMGWIGDKSCLLTTDSGASMATARPDINAGIPKRELTRLYVLELI